MGVGTVITIVGCSDIEGMKRRSILAGVMFTVSLSGCSALGIGSGPTGPVKTYLEAAQEGDQERAEEQFHEEARVSPDVDDDGSDITINTVEKRPVEDYVDDVNMDDVTVNRVENNIGGQVDDIGADDWALVYVEGESESGYSFDRYYVVVKDDGEWWIYQ